LAEVCSFVGIVAHTKAVGAAREGAVDCNYKNEKSIEGI